MRDQQTSNLAECANAHSVQRMVRPLCEIKTVDDGSYIRVWRFTAGWFTCGKKKGIIALYRTRKAYYFRVWDACLAYYKPSDEWIWKEWHWPKNVEV